MQLIGYIQATRIDHRIRLPFLVGQRWRLGDDETVIVITSAFSVDGRVTVIGESVGGSKGNICSYATCKSPGTHILVTLDHTGQDEIARVNLCSQHANETNSRLQEMVVREDD